MFETLLNGPVGQYMGQIDPTSYLQIAKMSISESGVKHASQLVKIVDNLILKINNGQVDPMLAMTGGDIQAMMGESLGGSSGNPVNGPSSQKLQIPKSTGGA